MMKTNSKTVSHQALALSLLLFVPSFARAGVGSSATEIRVKAVVEVDGTHEITLGDITEFGSLDESVVARLKQVPLADAPGPGETRSFTDVGLVPIFRSHLQEIRPGSGGVNLRIPSRVTVVRRNFRIRPQEIEAEIKTQMKVFCGECEFEISGLSLPAIGTGLPAGSKWRLLPRAEMPKGGFSLPLEITHEDLSRRMFWVSGTLAVRRRVPVASRALAAGEKVSSEDFTMQVRDVTFANDVPASEAELGSLVVARPVPAGQILWRSHVRRDVAIRNGDVVKVVAGGDAWSVTVDGVAQGSGYIGELIRVRIPRTQKIVSGLLKEKGLVEVR